MLALTGWLLTLGPLLFPWVYDGEGTATSGGIIAGVLTIALAGFLWVIRGADAERTRREQRFQEDPNA